MFRGRIGRLAFFLGFIYAAIPIVITIFLYSMVSFLFGSSGAAASVNPVRTLLNIIIYLLGAVGVIANLVEQFSLMARRWHDMDKSGWLSLLLLIPYGGFLIYLGLLFVPGSKGANKYGEPNNSRGLKATLFGSDAPAVSLQVPAQVLPPAPIAQTMANPGSAPTYQPGQVIAPPRPDISQPTPEDMSQTPPSA